MPDTAVEGRQRALLERLVALTDQQVSALDTGDVDLLTHLGDLRSQAVSDASAYLPPRAAWAPELAPLVAQVRERADDLQRAIHACMAVVRRDLTTRTHHQQATRYLSGARPTSEAPTSE